MTQSTTELAFTTLPSQNLVSEAELAVILANPGFGDHFTDYTAVIDWTKDGGWQNARVEPYGPIALDPAASVLHYGQEIFEGLKAYRHADGSVWTFRPEANAARLNRSAQRLALPELPESAFIGAVEALVQADQRWVPDQDGESLYLRPFMIATEAFLGVRAAHAVSFRVIASPAGNYFGGELKPISIWISRNYARAGRGGTGAAKCGGNYAASLLPQLEAEANGCKQVLFLDPTNDNAVEELGGMNVFFVFKDGTLVTPELSGSILEGVTRSSVLQLGRDRGMNVVERKITLDEWREGIASGEITEVFACGTAAVITPIGEIKDEQESIGDPTAPAGEVSVSLREELLGIQTGTVEDRHGWLHRLA
ncbi:branched-chain amino acid aminotransferase [Psychromicrobium xiongbiense]|uniref:branched-chain amino acid aminotransferase n=1 Tax=Psychromicrobium xiongbiense TaxID=3051184 RepID=UPI0025555B20|nr:branched-chain amino acid aminotransferase [Psychromicrobium sp. YIM S02556]